MLKFSKDFQGTEYGRLVEEKRDAEFYTWINSEIDEYGRKQGWF